MIVVLNMIHHVNNRRSSGPNCLLLVVARSLGSRAQVVQKSGYVAFIAAELATMNE